MSILDWPSIIGLKDVMPKSELFDMACEIKAETNKAWLLYDGKKQEWIPKSQAENNCDGTFTMPLWLAVEKGFV
jgi:hypothetical protein